jgi:hypothetical protein
MNDETVIKVIDIVKGPLCVSTEDGQILHDEIAPYIRGGKPITISFIGVTTLISAFLNAAIGQLYGEFPEDKIRQLLKVKGLEQDDLELLKRVNDNAKIYFKNKKGYDLAWRDEVGDEE